MFAVTSSLITLAELGEMMAILGRNAIVFDKLNLGGALQVSEWKLQLSVCAFIVLRAQTELFFASLKYLLGHVIGRSIFAGDFNCTMNPMSNRGSDLLDCSKPSA
ncbi:hypothetical protein WA026_019896 [Henosepilachna vigintioctopunctata]|uniref:Uncharacterized protein n=1 Tax=Henosepilachna vigintioctopunctata TaxID=420089 RepID=A0AAW1VHW9_9CUCU